jgi:hypothetical protein
MLEQNAFKMREIKSGEELSVGKALRGGKIEAVNMLTE